VQYKNYFAPFLLTGLLSVSAEKATCEDDDGDKRGRLSKEGGGGATATRRAGTG